MSRPKFRPTVYVLDKKNCFVTKVSTNTNDEIPDVVYLRAKIRVTPSIQKKTYEKDILSIKHDFENFARNILDSCGDYDNNYIFSVDISEKSVKFKKTSHLRYDIYVKPKEKKTLIEHKQILSDISDKLDDKLIALFKKYDLMWK